jgi:DNA-binding MarR family transcriptional regulator
MSARRNDVHEAIGRLQRLADLFRQRRAQLALGAGLTETQWAALDRIARDDFMPSLFARDRESSAPAVSRIIRQLLRKGLVTVSVSETDGRQRRYHLTTKGERTLDLLQASRRRAIDAVWMDLDPQGLAAFTTFSDQLIARLESYAARARQRPEENP